MNTPISWLKAYVPDLDVTAEEFVDAITLSGSHVEGYERKDKNLEKIVVGKILTMEKHPDADKLVVCQVDIGAEEPVQIVTGAKNVKVGDVIPVVLDGGKVAAAHGDDNTYPDGIKIKKGKLRGVLSNGMMCVLRSLALQETSIRKHLRTEFMYFLRHQELSRGITQLRHLVLTMW